MGFFEWIRRGWRGEGRQVGSQGEGPPVLEWVMRANGALAAWLVGPGARETAGPPGGVAEDVDRLVRMRLEQHRAGDGQGVERMDRGVLVYASLEGRSAGLLLPSNAGAARRDQARHDLARLVDYDRWRPTLVEVSKQQGRPDESVDSIALRLAHHIERHLGIEVAVGIPEPSAIRIAGVSLRTDRRLLGTLVPDDSPLALVGTGRKAAMRRVEDPFGGAVADRRARWGLAFVAPIPWTGPVAAAVALWTPSGAEPVGEDFASLTRALDAAAPRLRVALERRRLEEAASRDPLTGVFNRRGLDDKLRSIAVGSGTLVYADLDHFKKLNDTLGHPAGDDALVHFSRVLLGAIRDGDTVARIGGEEFALWLPGASLERGRLVAERVRQLLSARAWSWQGRPWPISASFGVAACPETAPRVSLLPEQADRALYAAKRAGRDRVAAFASASDHPPGISNQE